MKFAGLAKRLGVAPDELAETFFDGLVERLRGEQLLADHPITPYELPLPADPVAEEALASAVWAGELVSDHDVKKLAREDFYDRFAGWMFELGRKAAAMGIGRPSPMRMAASLEKRGLGYKERLEPIIKDWWLRTPILVDRQLAPRIRLLALRRRLLFELAKLAAEIRVSVVTNDTFGCAAGDVGMSDGAIAERLAYIRRPFATGGR